MAKPKRFAQWDEPVAKNHDPEADVANDSQSSASDDEGADLAGTEHYVSVGKSKLRQKDNVSLGPQYRGARVSRQALAGDNESQDESDDFKDAQEILDSSEAEGSGEEHFDDPETADLAADEARLNGDDSEIESDDALGNSDDENLNGFVFRGSATRKDADPKSRKRRPTAADFISDSEAEINGEAELDDEEEDISGEDVSDDEDVGGADLFDLEAENDSDDSGSNGESDVDGDEGDFSGEEDEDEGSMKDDDEEEEDSDESDEDAKAGPRGRRGADARAEQRKLMNEGQKALVATMSAAAQQDAQKGQAVRQQRKVFDGLLNIRIRLQKAVVAANSFPAFDNEPEQQETEPYQAAEAAALKLLDTLDGVRSSLLPSQIVAGEKRKRGDETGDSISTEALWQDLTAEDKRAAKHRKKVLENWSNKTKHTTVEVKSRNLMSSRQSIVASLEDQLFDSDRLVKRTRTARSCAPIQVANKVNEDEAIYDDADFYQLLLKELVDQRTSDETATQAAGNASLATVKWAAMKEAKTKKHVDRRASKGRKMRFNIHEKLQNFMAPEDRRSWEQEAIDRLFGTLFGQKMELTEGGDGDGGASDEDMGDGVTAEEEGLRLFRS